MVVNSGESCGKLSLYTILSLVLWVVHSLCYSSLTSFCPLHGLNMSLNFLWFHNVKGKNLIFFFSMKFPFQSFSHISHIKYGTFDHSPLYFVLGYTLGFCLPLNSQKQFFSLSKFFRRSECNKKNFVYSILSGHIHNTVVTVNVSAGYLAISPKWPFLAQK